MAYDAKTERLIALKKLAGKAQTSNDKGLANEGLPSGITSTSETIFGEAVTTSPSSTSLYTVTGQVEYLRFPTTFIAGSDTSSGRHGFELKLPSDYESNSSNPSAGTYPFKNNQTINITSGSLQLVPPSFATSYEAKPYYGGSSTKDSGTQIPLLDARDWYLDYFNGVFFQQDPSGIDDQADNPDYVEAYLYIGQMLNNVVQNSAGGSGNSDKSAKYLVLEATGSLTQERVFTKGTGISTTDAGSGGSYTVAIDNSVVATLTGSVFSGAVSAPALSGSLTKLADGTSYMVGGANIAITSASNGSITLSSTANVVSRSKQSYFLSSGHSPGSAIAVGSSDFSAASYDPDKIDIFVNGMLLHSGSSAQVTAGQRDYYVSSAASLKFSFKLDIDDVIDVVVFSIA